MPLNNFLHNEELSRAKSFLVFIALDFRFPEQCGKCLHLTFFSNFSFHTNASSNCSIHRFFDSNRQLQNGFCSLQSNSRRPEMAMFPILCPFSIFKLIAIKDYGFVFFFPDKSDQNSIFFRKTRQLMVLDWSIQKTHDMPRMPPVAKNLEISRYSNSSFSKINSLIRSIIALIETF